MIQINGVEIEFNPTDWKETELEEKARETFRKALPSLRGLKGSDAIKRGCLLIFKYFDNAFGKGAGKKILGAETDYVKCVGAMTESVAQIARVQQELIDAAERLNSNVVTANAAANDGTNRGN